MKSIPLITLLMCLCLEASCSNGPYHYAAEQNAPGNETFQSGDAIHGVPELNPIGRLRVRYFGIENSRMPSGQPTKAIHVVIIVTNQSSGSTWEMDSKDQSVSFPNGMLRHPISAKPETLRIEPGQRVGMDLSIPFPKELSTEEQVPKFLLHTLVRTPAHNYTQITAFDRLSGTEGAPSYDQGWNPPYNVLSGLLFGPEYGFF